MLSFEGGGGRKKKPMPFVCSLVVASFAPKPRGATLSLSLPFQVLERKDSVSFLKASGAG